MTRTNAPTKTRRWPARTAVAAAVMTAVLLGAAPAFAHVEAAGEATDSGLTQVTFSFTHGCNGQPTTGLRVQLPAGTQDIQPTEKAGWNYGVNNGVISWTGGSIPDSQAASFVATMTIPGQAGQTVYFPTIQSCPNGAEEAWIDETPDPEAPSAAPRIQLVIDGPTTTTTAAPTTTTTEAPTTTTTAAPTTTTTTTAVSTTTSTGPGTTVPLQPVSNDSSPWPWIILIVIAAVGAAIIGVLLWQRSQAAKAAKAAEADRAAGPGGPGTGSGTGTGTGTGSPPTTGGPPTGGPPTTPPTTPPPGGPSPTS